MPGYFTKIEVADPHMIPQSIWENLPPSERTLLTERAFSSQEWAPLDRRRFRIEPESVRSEVSVANVGGLRATWIFSNGDRDDAPVARSRQFCDRAERAGREPAAPFLE